MPRPRREIDMRRWRNYLVAFDQHLTAVRANDTAAIALTRAAMLANLQRTPDAELASRAEWGSVGFPDHPPFDEARSTHG